MSTSLDSGELSQENTELFVSNLLSREQSELNGSSDYYGNGAIQKSLPSCSGNIYDIQENDGGGTGGTPGSNTGPNNGGNNCIESANAPASSVKQELIDNSGNWGIYIFLSDITNFLLMNQCSY